MIAVILLLAACGGPATTVGPGSTATGSGVASAPPALTKKVLVVGTDIGDTRSLDPHRQFDTSPYLSMHAVYENLLTVAAPNYTELVPQLATSWELVDDGAAWLFHLRDGVKFPSGNSMTSADVKFSFDRLKNLKDTPSVVAENLASVEAIDPLTVKLTMADKTQPLLTFLMGSGTWGILDSKVVGEKGGVSDATAETADAATAFLDQTSAGTGPYQVTSWERNQEIVLTPNPNYWGDKAAFERIIIRHFSDTSAALLALEREDIDLAQNLNSDQLKTLEGNPKFTVTAEPSLDVLYWTLSENHPQSGALKQKAARQAVAHAVDYQGLIDGLLGGFAVRPATFMPIGMGGSTQAYADQNAVKEDLDKARALLVEAGSPDGFSFDLSYGTSTFAGVPFEAIAQKIKSDLARVGIVANLKPADTTTFTTAFRAGETVSGLAPWASDGPEPWLMAEAAVNRLAKRANWTPTAAQIDTVVRAGGETDPAKRDALYQEFQTAMLDQAGYIVPFQPVYRIAVGSAITNVKMTAAGWFIELSQIKPAK